MQREIWSSRTGFILATVGSAVGLGNIWRFNYLTYENGGGAFLIPYFVALFTAGISLIILELALGSKFKGAAPLALKRANKRFEWIGWWAALSGFIITMYYVVIVGWALIYLEKAFVLGWGEDANGYFFGTVLQLTDSAWDLGGFPVPVLLGAAAVWGVTWIVEAKGVQAGIEKANRIFMPLLWILALVLVARALTLEGAFTGIDWYLKPDFNRLFEYHVWLAAYGQIFYTLGIGMAIMIAYGSYLPDGSDIANNALIVSLANGAFSFLMGFAVFGTLGYMAAASGQGVDQVVADGIGLAFVVFPTALNLLPGLNALTAVAFFACLVVAGLSSLVSLVEGFVASLMDKFEMERGRAVRVTVVFGLLGSLLYASRGGLYWLDIVDHFIMIYGLLVVGTLEAVAIGWIFGAGKIKEWVNASSDVRAGIWWDLSVKLIVPVVLVVLVAEETASNLATPYGGYPQMAAYLGMALMAAGIALSLLLSMVRREVD